MGNFDDLLSNFRALFRVYTQLQDYQGKNEQGHIFVLKIGSGDKKNVPLNARAYLSFLFLRDRWW